MMPELLSCALTAETRTYVCMALPGTVELCQRYTKARGQFDTYTYGGDNVQNTKQNSGQVISQRTCCFSYLVSIPVPAIDRKSP